MKEALISMAMFGPGNQYVQRNEAVLSSFNGFKEVLEKVLPPSIGFLDIIIRVPDVVLVTKTGEFVLDASSGGVMSLIDLAWQIFLFAQDKDEFVVLLDEPENHLHPSMQRSVLNSLLGSFPAAQFVVATHSPFIVSSVKDSNVYALRHDRSNDETRQELATTVQSIRLDSANRAGTASEILRDVLGVPVTLPEWAEREIQAIAASYSVENINNDTLAQLRSTLEDAGLGEYYPDTLKLIAQRE